MRAQTDTNDLDDLASLDDLTFIEERGRVRALLALGNERGSERASLEQRLAMLDVEFDRRAKAAWTKIDR